jgi:sugar O-acyltransferase (sialic acid O-acetyltransferase NeuD family)
MIIAGAKGHSLEILQVLTERDFQEDICFYDDINKDLPDKYFDIYPIIKSHEHLNQSIEINAKFVLGLGGTHNRYILNNIFLDLKGVLNSVISEKAYIGNLNVEIGNGVNIMPFAVIYNNSRIGEGSLINTASTVHHDTSMGKFCELSPGSRLLGNSTIGDFTSLGTNSCVLPHINVGSNVIIGAGSVVTKHVPDNSLVLGVPGIIYKNTTKDHGK